VTDIECHLPASAQKIADAAVFSCSWRTSPRVDRLGGFGEAENKFVLHGRGSQPHELRRQHGAGNRHHGFRRRIARRF